jgi:hypothetical protein
VLWFVLIQPRRQRTDINIDVEVPEVAPGQGSGTPNR